MKLGGSATGLDAQKEEREVKEACRIWKEGAGRMKAAMGEGVPEIEEDWKGTTMTGRSEPCKLCKLGRGELVPGLKEKPDREGWWDRRWGGHGSCKQFWNRNGREAKMVKY